MTMSITCSFSMNAWATLSEVRSAPTSGQQALRARSEEFLPNVVLLDLMMPGLDGRGTCRLLRAQPELRDAKIVMLSARSDIAERLAAYEAGAVDYISKPFDLREILAKVNTWTDMIHKQQVEAIWEDLEQTRNGIGLTLTSLVEFRDTETGDHLFRMRWYSQLLAEQLAIASPYAQLIDETFLRKLYRASPLHDIGGRSPIELTLFCANPGRLTNASEFEIIKRHTVIGSDILSRAATDLPSADYLGTWRSLSPGTITNVTTAPGLSRKTDCRDTPSRWQRALFRWPTSSTPSPPTECTTHRRHARRGIAHH